MALLGKSESTVKNYALCLASMALHVKWNQLTNKFANLQY